MFILTFRLSMFCSFRLGVFFNVSFLAFRMFLTIMLQEYALQSVVERSEMRSSKKMPSWLGIKPRFSHTLVELDTNEPLNIENKTIHLDQSIEKNMLETLTFQCC